MQRSLRLALVTVLVGGAAWAAETTRGRPPAERPAGGEEGIVEPKADAALRRMSDYLSNLKSLRVHAVSIDEKVATDGQKIQEIQDQTLVLQRPGDLRVERVSPRGHAILVSNGKQATVFNRERNVYATTAAPATVDEAVDRLRERLHVDAPGGDLLVKDPYGALIDGTVTGRYVGLEPINGTTAHHLAFTRKDLDWQIWIKDGDEPLPLRYVITSKDMPSQPEFTIELSDWQPNTPVTASDFAFTPPAGAKRIDVTTQNQGQLSTPPNQLPSQLPNRPVE